jgi:hypothetical protein
MSIKNKPLFPLIFFAHAKNACFLKSAGGGVGARTFLVTTQKMRLKSHFVFNEQIVIVTPFFYQVRQGRTWSRNYKSPSSSSSSFYDRFRIFIKFC